jgi:hypothetical protein
MLLVLIGCIEPFDVAYDLDATQIVIIGILTDKDPARVEITRPATSANSRKISLQRISGASVELVNDQGSREVLEEVSNGVYLGTEPGQMGSSYHVEVILPDDRLVISGAQMLKPSPGIDSLFLEPVVELRAAGTSVQLDRRGLNLNTYMDRSDTVATYYRWSVSGTYQMYNAFDYTNAQGPCYVPLPETPSFALAESASAGSDLIVKTLTFLRPNSTFAYGQSIEISQYAAESRKLSLTGKR